MAARPLRVLLVEDDEGDALIVRLLLEDSSAPVVLTCVPTLSAAERRGTEALAAGAQDYLVKGHVDGELLARSVRYAVERRRADHAQRQLTLARVKAAENTRLERGLLPTPLVTDERLRVATHYRAGRRRALLGGDFYDVVEDGDGCVHAVIGDVSGHGPDEAAVGVCLRIAWRTLVLAGCAADEVLPLLQEVLEAERHHRGVFATLADLRIEPDRGALSLRAAGHPARCSCPGPARARSRSPPAPAVRPSAWSPRSIGLPPGSRSTRAGASCSTPTEWPRGGGPTAVASARRASPTWCPRR